MPFGAGAARVSLRAPPTRRGGTARRRPALGRATTVARSSAPHCTGGPDDPEDGRPQQVLASVRVTFENRKHTAVRALPDEGVDGNDRSGEGRGTPIGGQVDDGWWQVRVEKHVAGQIAVDQLPRLVHRAEVLGQPGHRRQRRELLDGAVLPGGSVGSGERIGTPKVPVRYRDVGAGPVETLAGGTESPAIASGGARHWFAAKRSNRRQRVGRRRPALAGLRGSRPAQCRRGCAPATAAPRCSYPQA